MSYIFAIKIGLVFHPALYLRKLDNMDPISRNSDFPLGWANAEPQQKIRGGGGMKDQSIFHPSASSPARISLTVTPTKI